jgi:dipeptidyl aminopeptidase/acylaminoacyl peptidase
MKKTILLLLLLGLNQAIFAQNSLSIESLLNFKRIGAPASSPDGKNLCYALEEISVEKNKGFKDLYVISSDGKKTQRLSETPDKEWSPIYSHDGSTIFFLCNEGGSPQVWSCKTDGSSRKKITDVKDGVGGFHINTVAGKIYLLSEVKTGQDIHDLYPDVPQSDARIIDDLMYRHWDSWDDFLSVHLFYADFNFSSLSITSNLTNIVSGEPYDVENFAVSPDGNSIAYACKKKYGKAYAVSTNTDIYLYDIKTGATSNLSKGNMGYDMNPVFSTKGNLLVWESMAEDGFESDKSSILLYDFAKKSYENLNPTFAESAGTLVWSEDDKSIYFTAAIEATIQIYKMDLATRKIEMLSNGDHDFNSLTLIDGGLAGLQTTISRPAEIFSYLFKSKTTQQLTQVNTDALAKIKMGKVEKKWVTTSDGKKMLVWHVLPPDFDPQKKYPTLLYCQGGPQSMVSCFFSYRWNLQLMAANGYIVVAPNRRGLPGFGEEWNDQISGDWAGQPMKDYFSAIDDASTLPYVDKSRLGAVGASYGGYSVYWLAGNHQNRFKTFIAHCGLFNLESWYTATEEMFFANKDIKGPYWSPERKDDYSKFSPHKFVQNWNTPILVIHNEKDFRVPLGEGLQAFGAAQMKDLKSRFLYFPDEGHWVQKPQNSLVWHRIFYDWLKKTL